MAGIPGRRGPGLWALNDLWFQRMMHHHEEALEASLEWERRKPEITKHLKSIPGNETDFNLRKALKDNWTLSDLMDKWSWHERQSKLYSSCLAGMSAYLANKNLLNMREAQ